MNGTDVFLYSGQVLSLIVSAGGNTGVQASK